MTFQEQLHGLQSLLIEGRIFRHFLNNLSGSRRKTFWNSQFFVFAHAVFSKGVLFVHILSIHQFIEFILVILPNTQHYIPYF